jgi:hypothetical protein
MYAYELSIKGSAVNYKGLFNRALCERLYALVSSLSAYRAHITEWHGVID